MTTNKNASVVNQIAKIWIEIMQAEFIPSTYEQLAAWWIEHQNEITFAFKVLEGLSLVKKISSNDGMIVWGPSRKMERLHRKSRQYYHRYSSEYDYVDDDDDLQNRVADQVKAKDE